MVCRVSVIRGKPRRVRVICRARSCAASGHRCRPDCWGTFDGPCRRRVIETWHQLAKIATGVSGMRRAAGYAGRSCVLGLRRMNTAGAYFLRGRVPSIVLSRRSLDSSGLNP